MKQLSIFIFFISFCLNAQKQSKLIDSVLKDLDIKLSDCKVELIVEKVIPNNPSKSIVVIPEIASQVFEENDCCFELNSYILVVDNETYQIDSKFFEVSQANNWVSDAVELRKISIDTAPYLMSNKKRAFGIRVHFIGSSRVNPFDYETISLFEQKGNTLKRLLKNYIVEENNGIWDGNCNGEFNSKNKILIVSDYLTNSYADILVKTKITKSITSVDENEDCKEKTINSHKREILRFKNGTYTLEK